jgi:hypothetical protein
VVLLDTDMIAVSTIRPYLGDTALVAKVVDLPNPPIPVLDQITALAGMSQLPETVKVDVADEMTYAGIAMAAYTGCQSGCAIRWTQSGDAGRSG